MKYTVYENGKKAEIVNSRYEVWSSATFNNKRDAEVYAYLWCYMVTRQGAEALAPEMAIGKKYDFSQFGAEVLMHIEEEE